LGAGLALAGGIVLLLAISNWIGRSPGWAYDFHAYYDAALRLIATGTPYQAETLGGPFRPGPFGLYLYSPVPALLFVPLTSLGVQTGVVAWLTLRVGLLVAACALMPVPRAVRLATLGIAGLSAPVLFDLNLGNVSLIVTFCAVVVWRYLDRPIGSIALAVSLTMRPTMALIGGWWLLRGLWRPVLWTAVAGLAILVATLPFVGIERWLELVTVLRNVSNVTGVRANVDLGSSVLLMGGPAWLAQVALYAGYAIAAGAVVLSLRRDRELSFVVTVMATLLLSPLLWDHYLTNLLIVAAFLASRGRWWGLLLPLLCWSPQLLAIMIPGMRGIAEFVLAYVALAGLLLPFLAHNRGERVGTLLDRVAAWRTGRRTREPARA
jgi:hypothetical protein